MRRLARTLGVAKHPLPPLAAFLKTEGTRSATMLADETLPLATQKE